MDIGGFGGVDGVDGVYGVDEVRLSLVGSGQG